MRAISALAVVATFVSGPLSSVAAADPRLTAGAQQTVPESTTDQKAEAARQLGLILSPEMAVMTDCDFVIFLWDKAKVPADAKVKEAAATAFTNHSSNPQSCYDFIVRDIFPAHQEDLRERLRKAQRDQQRLKAAEVVGWYNLSQGDLDVALKEFVFRIWERAEANSEVRNQASAVLTPTSTDEQRTTYVVTGIFTARDLDVQRKQEQSRVEEQQRQERLRDEERRAHAWQVVARSVLPDSLKLITHREFVYEIFNRAATGSRMKAAAQTALDAQSQDVAKEFIYTGVDRAHQADLEERDRLDAIETEKAIRKILDEAERDGLQPMLVLAARAALSGDLAARHTFLNTGQYEARLRDRIKPANRRVVEFQGAASSRCIQTVGVGDHPLQDGQVMELWDCVRGPKQVWEMYQVVEGEYMLQNLYSKKCLTISGDVLAQTNCDSAQPNLRWKFIEDTRDGTYQMQNVGTGRFATAKDSGTSNATLVVGYGNTNDGHQRWRLLDRTHRLGIATVKSGPVKVKGVQSSRCMQTAGLWDRPNEGALADLAAMELWDCVGGGKMTWEILPLGDKKYALKNQLSGKCLDVKYGSVDRGTPFVQYSCHYGGTQQFVFTEAGDNTYGLQSVLTAQYADAIGNAVHNGAVIQTWDHTGYANQRWRLDYGISGRV